MDLLGRIAVGWGDGAGGGGTKGGGKLWQLKVKFNSKHVIFLVL